MQISQYPIEIVVIVINNTLLVSKLYTYSKIIIFNKNVMYYYY